MSANFGNNLVVAISSRALFNLDDSHTVYEEQGLEAYQQYQIEHEDEVLEPGDAFPLVNKLLRISLPTQSPQIELFCISYLLYAIKGYG